MAKLVHLQHGPTQEVKSVLEVKSVYYVQCVVKEDEWRPASVLLRQKFSRHYFERY